MTYQFTCDRCGAMEAGDCADLVASEYLVDEPAAHTGALCPACARHDDPLHIAGSWLLTWG